jgi:hypothetical protein
MHFEWLAWSNPVAIWWGFLLAISMANIALWLLLHRGHRGHRGRRNQARGLFGIELLVLLSAIYVFVCAFRSVLPRADVQRICLFDTWLSSVLVGRSVATVAEICFVVQWAIVLHYLAILTRSNAARSISFAVVPLIALAELFSWYAVITTDYLGNAIENSIWALTFVFIGAALFQLMPKFRGVFQLAIGAVVIGVACYVAFLVFVDVPMYFNRWQADLMSGKELLGLFTGFKDVTTRWAVTHEIAHWQDEIAWMSLYFSFAVWASLALASLALVQDRLLQYRRVSAEHPIGLRVSGEYYRPNRRYGGFSRQTN